MCWGGPLKPEGQGACQLFGSLSGSQQDCMGWRQAWRAGLGQAGVWGGYSGLGERVVGDRVAEQSPSQQRTSPSLVSALRMILSSLPQRLCSIPRKLTDHLLVREQDRVANILRDELAAEIGHRMACRCCIRPG